MPLVTGTRIRGSSFATSYCSCDPVGFGFFVTGEYPGREILRDLRYMICMCRDHIIVHIQAIKIRPQMSDIDEAVLFGVEWDCILVCIKLKAARLTPGV